MATRGSHSGTVLSGKRRVEPLPSILMGDSWVGLLGLWVKDRALSGLTKKQVRNMKPHLLLQWRMALRHTASAASEVLWFHGTNTTQAMDSIIKSQELHGSGDLGNGGYVSSDPSWAEEYGQLVAVILEPRNPKYGGERELWDFQGDYTAMLRGQGHDVWFPTDGTSPSSPGQIAVILDSSCAKFFRAPRGVRNPTPRTSQHDKMAESARRSWTASLSVAVEMGKPFSSSIDRIDGYGL